MYHVALLTVIALGTIIAATTSANRETVEMEGKDDLKPLHFRVGVKTLVDVSNGFVEELTFETTEPAHIVISVKTQKGGGGSGLTTKVKAGESRARGGCRIFLAYVNKTKENPFVTRSCFIYGFEVLDETGASTGGSASGKPVEAPDAIYLNEILKLKLKAGVYPYTSLTQEAVSDDKPLEVLSLGASKVELSVSPPAKKKDSDR